MVIAEMDKTTKNKVDCNRTKDEEGVCDEAVEWHPPYGLGSSSRSIYDEMRPICTRRLQEGERLGFMSQSR